MLKKDLDHWTDLYDAEMMQHETEIMRVHNALEQQREDHTQLRIEVNPISSEFGFKINYTTGH